MPETARLNSPTCGVSTSRGIERALQRRQQREGVGVEHQWTARRCREHRVEHIAVLVLDPERGPDHQRIRRLRAATRKRFGVGFAQHDRVELRGIFGQRLARREHGYQALRPTRSAPRAASRAAPVRVAGAAGDHTRVRARACALPAWPGQGGSHSAGVFSHSEIACAATTLSGAPISATTISPHKARARHQHMRWLLAHECHGERGAKAYAAKRLASIAANPARHIHGDHALRAAKRLREPRGLAFQRARQASAEQGVHEQFRPRVVARRCAHVSPSQALAASAASPASASRGASVSTHTGQPFSCSKRAAHPTVAAIVAGPAQHGGRARR